MAIDDKDRHIEAECPTRLLLDCHDKIRGFSNLILRLDVHVIHYGIDDDVRQAAGDILNHFEIEVPLHHADEQGDLFPLLRSLGMTELTRSLDALEVERERLDELWRTVRPWLDSVQRRRPLPRPKSIGEFATRYPAYADREEREAYCAADRLSPKTARLLTRSMQKRRELAQQVLGASRLPARASKDGRRRGAIARF